MVFDNRNVILVCDVQQFPPALDRHNGTRRVLVGHKRVDELRLVTTFLTLFNLFDERVHLHAMFVDGYAHQLGALFVIRSDRSAVGKLFHQNDIARLFDEVLGHQGNRLHRTCGQCCSLNRQRNALSSFEPVRHHLPHRLVA